MRSGSALSWIVALALLGHACVEPFRPTCGRSDSLPPTGPTGVDELDLLLVIDGSSTMSEEQVLLASELPRLVQVLASGDRDGDGFIDFDRVRSLHVGVISADMGTGPVVGAPSCEAGLGDDGILRDRGASDPRCMTSYPSRVFEFVDVRSDADAFATDVACVATLGADGCCFAQPLEASLKALSLVPSADGASPVTWTRPGYRPPRFLDDTFGHGGSGGENDGFLRPDSALVILLLTDHDDCSVSDPSIFDPTDPVDLGLRCHTFADGLRPIERYVDGLIGLRAQPSLLGFTAIVGIPPDAIGDGLSYDGILAHEAMSERIDPAQPDRLLPSCRAPGDRGVAFPTRRIVQVAAGLERLGASTSVHSICGDFTTAIDGLLDQAAAMFAPACLHRGVSPDETSYPSCDVFELLPLVGSGAAIEHCADLPSPEAFERVGDELTVDGGVVYRRERCRLRYVGRSGAGSIPGWFFGETAPGELGCREPVELSVVTPVEGAAIQLVCAQTILPGERPPERGASCDPSLDPDLCARSTASPDFPASTLACDAFDRTCQLPCSADADCEAAGLRGYFCDHRTADDVFGAAVPDALVSTREQPRDFCVNPTCEADLPRAGVYWSSH